MLMFAPFRNELGKPLRAHVNGVVYLFPNKYNTSYFHLADR